MKKNISLLEATQLIIKKSESLILNTPKMTINTDMITKLSEPNHRLVSFLENLVRVIIITPPFLSYGIKVLFRPVVLSFIVTGPLFCLLYLIGASLTTNKDTIQIGSFLSLTWALASVLVAFSPPSTYALNSRELNKTENMIKFISGLGFNTEDSLKQLDNNLSLAAERVNARSKTYQLMTAGIWALTIPIVTIWINYVLKQSLPFVLIQHVISKDFFYIVAYILLLFTSILMVAGLKRANDAIFDLLKLSTHELRFQITNQALATQATDDMEDNQVKNTGIIIN